MPARHHLLVRLAVWGSLYLLAGTIGRLTIIDGQSLSLVWPAAGVAALWLASATRRTLPYDVGLLSLSIFSVNAATGASGWLALVFVVTNLLQTGLFVLLVRWRSPGLYLFGGRDAPGTLKHLVSLLVGAVAASGVAASLGVLGVGLLGGDVGLSSMLVWWGRNCAGLLVIGVLGLLLLARAAQQVGSVAAETLPEATPSHWEPVAHALLSGGLLWFVFGSSDALPIGFLLLFTTVMVAVRLGPLGVVVHSLAVGSGAIALTLLGRGPFAEVADLAERALVAQVFVVMTVLTGLVLAFSRNERNRALGELADLQRATAARARLFEGVLEQMQEGIAVVDAEGHYLMRNPAGRRLTERLESADHGLRHVDGRDVAPHELPQHRAMQGEFVREDFQFGVGQDQPILLEVTAAPMSVEDRGTAIVNFRDVTAARHDRDALASFAGVVAHDLKRPLTVVHGWSAALADELARGPVTSDEGMPMLDRVTRAADQMGRLIDDLLHYTVVRDAPLRPVVVDLSEAAVESAAVFRERSSRPAISVQPGLSAYADPVMVRQVLDNLIGNAIKYVAPDVRPEVRVTGRPEGGRTVLEVADNGIGIPADQRERVFETFHRVHREEYRGTGLGLAIVRRAVERSGGSVAVRDNPRGGTTFEVRLPAPPAVPVAPPAPEPVAERPVPRLALVDERVAAPVAAPA